MPCLRMSRLPKQPEQRTGYPLDEQRTGCHALFLCSLFDVLCLLRLARREASVNDGIAIEMRDVVKRFGEVSAVDGSRATVVAPDGLALCGQSYQPLRLDEPAFISIELAARLGDGAGVHDRADRRRDPVFQK